MYLGWTEFFAVLGHRKRISSLSDALCDLICFPIAVIRQMLLAITLMLLPLWDWDPLGSRVLFLFNLYVRRLDTLKFKSIWTRHTVPGQDQQWHKKVREFINANWISYPIYPGLNEQIIGWTTSPSAKNCTALY